MARLDFSSMRHLCVRKVDFALIQRAFFLKEFSMGAYS